MTKIKSAEKEIKAILKKNNLKIGYDFSFPIYRQLPDEVQLALMVLGKHKMRVIISFVPISKPS